MVIVLQTRVGKRQPKKKMAVHRCRAIRAMMNMDLLT